MSTPDEKLQCASSRSCVAMTSVRNGLDGLDVEPCGGKLKAEDWRFVFETYRPDAEAADGLRVSKLTMAGFRGATALTAIEFDTGCASSGDFRRERHGQNHHRRCL